MDGGGLNYTNKAEGTVKRMTDAEAQAVIELWAQRRKAEEVEATMPSALELSEALNVPQAEVEALLLEVRRSREPEAILESMAKKNSWGGNPSRNRIWAIAIISVLLATVVYAFVASAMKPNMVPLAPTPRLVAVAEDWGTTAATPPAQPLPSANAPAIVEDHSASIPAGLHVEFDGRALQGERSLDIAQNNDLTIQLQIERSIRAFVAEVSKVPLGGEDLRIDSQNLVSALLNDKSEYSGFFIWRPLTVSVGNHVTGVQIPICVNVQELVQDAVKLEQDRRIAKAASQAVEMVRGRWKGR